MTPSVALGELTTLVVEAPLPSFAERRAAWASRATASEVMDVAAKFRLSIGQIEDAAEVARLAAHARGDATPSLPELDLGARQASSSQLAELASRLEPSFGWADLVLPERPLEILRSISAYLRHRDLVLSEWGYERTVARNQGIKVLFAGESGTGKTMAGQVLARELGLDLFRIDLATVVSKYIGETEKNLDRIFSAAEGSNAILFFDEADALFGKRSEVRDSHDRYANIEVAYLLQKMESYPGAVILATNFRQNMDDAFLRRLDVVVDFPFPEPEDRERIWHLVLPDSAPLADDIDVSFLATQFRLSGGGIRNCLARSGVPCGGGGRGDRDAPPRARRRARVRQARPPHARGRLRTVPSSGHEPRNAGRRMSTYALAPERRRRRTDDPQREEVVPELMPPYVEESLNLQRTAGNAAVSQALGGVNAAGGALLQRIPNWLGDALDVRDDEEYLDATEDLGRLQSVQARSEELPVDDQARHVRRCVLPEHERAEDHLTVGRPVQLAAIPLM